jgi:cytochrome c-type biogenesis protein CcmI
LISGSRGPAASGALSFLLIPILRGRRAQREEDRTALNVALYQERVAELQAQQGEGVLDAAQMDKGRDEAARELLADTEGVEAPRVAPGQAMPCWRRCWCRCWAWGCTCISAPATRSS